MAIRFSDLEQLGMWCANAEEMEDALEEAAAIFFEADEEGVGEYAEGGADYASVGRRFIAWFMFGHTLPGGERPAEIAARNVFKRRRLDEALAAIAGVRYVVGGLTAVHPDRAVFVQVGNERLEIRDKRLADPSTRGATLFSWVLPVRPRVWIPGPGWMVMPLSLGPSFQDSMNLMQWNPVDAELLLRNPASPEPGGTTFEELTLVEAVNRMTKAAKADRRPALMMTVTEWEQLVLRYMQSHDNASFFEHVAELVGGDVDLDGLNLWIGRAQDIWNSTPQPDRGGRTPLEKEQRQRGGR